MIRVSDVLINSIICLTHSHSVLMWRDLKYCPVCYNFSISSSLLWVTFLSYILLHIWNEPTLWVIGPVYEGGEVENPFSGNTSKTNLFGKFTSLNYHSRPISAKKSCLKEMSPANCIPKVRAYPINLAYFSTKHCNKSVKNKVPFVTTSLTL